MAVKHHLTKKSDHFKGDSRDDLFLGSAIGGIASLTNKDVLNGGGGIDTITAKLFGTTMAPHLAQIEKAVFTRLSTKDLTLDLAHATAMRNVTLKSFDADVTINHAGKLSTLAINNSDNHNYNVNGINTTKVGTEKLSFTDAVQVLIDFQNRNDLSFKGLDVVVKNSHIGLNGDFGAPTLAVHSHGLNNTLVINPDMAAAASVRTINVDGAGALSLIGNSLTSLETFNASRATGNIYASIGSIGVTTLTKVLGGAGDDTIGIYELGGSAAAPASVFLGEGNDVVGLNTVILDPAKHVIDGGGGVDTAIIKGNLTDIGSKLTNFEALRIYEATGFYDLMGSGISHVQLQDQQGAVTVKDLMNGGEVSLSGTSGWATTVSVMGALGGTDDTVVLSVDGKFGSVFSGFNSSGLTNLEIQSEGDDANVLYLGAIGANGDSASITITGDQFLTLGVTKGARYISSVTINNDAGVNLLTFAESQSFVDTGATIKGGKGNDRLVGGVGNDVISTGTGDNIVHASLGIDTINFELDSGMDTFVIGSTDFASGSSIDTINNFGFFDRIDITALDLSSLLVWKGDDFNTSSEGEAALPGLGTAAAFFAKDDHTLYVDINGDGTIEPGDVDVVVHLNGLDSFSSAMLLS